MKTVARTLISLIVIYSIAFPIGLGLVRARKIFFPLAYRMLVHDKAFGNHLDPLLVAALIYSESSFRVQAISKSGAMGLMQLMPETAVQLAQERGIKNFSVEKLFEPELNLELGCYYLSKLYREFPDIDHSLIAYNAGRSNLIRWQGEGNPLSQTFPQTRQYVIKIRWIYRLLKMLDAIYGFF